MESFDHDQRIAALEHEVAGLKDTILTLVGCVQYRDDKPYDAAVCQMLATGEERVRLSLVLRGITTRLQGAQHAAKPTALLPDDSCLAEAYSDGPMSVPEALKLLERVVGPADAAEVLHAFNQQYSNGLTLE
ncbi:hypothetical protein [uncultured Tessaracoccus sp.]|uniref:hypothetical protein n=1 Tax=uncultured Tessaracoccus sp. TaxID=905023 RepID=UPI0025DC7818|nr:hypothetical protein [uncultured Tessaracoccus sp.]